LNFLQDEVRLQSQVDVERWQSTLKKLFGFMLRHGMPMERLQLKSFQGVVVHARQAEEALLVTLHACASVTQTLSTVDWPSSDAMGAWLARLQGQRTTYATSPLVFRCLRLLNLSSCVLMNRDLYEVDLRYAVLSDTVLSSADLRYAVLSDAVLRYAVLRYAVLSYAVLGPADLRYADLRSAVLSDTVLSDAVLSDAVLSDANLSYAVLSDADLSDAVLSDANLSYAVLSDADLSDAVLSDAVLSDAVLSDAVLRNAVLRNADLRNAVLRSAVLLETDLRGSKNITTEQLSGENAPCLCGVALPDNIDLDPNRDCKRIPQLLSARNSLITLEEAQQMVEEAKAKTWD